MTPKRMLLALALGTLVSACGLTNSSPRSTSKDSVPKILFAEEVQPLALNTTEEAQEDPSTDVSQYTVTDVKVHVGSDLVVSERNSYYPGVDIVWRGDPPGNRYQQVKAIFEDAFSQGTDDLQGARQVELHVDVRRFHALTEKARFTVGGVHAITFAVLKRDSETGEAVGEVKVIRADLKAYGGQTALVAMRLGQTQKVRITDHLASVIRTELTSQDGYENERLGPLQALNQL